MKITENKLDYLIASAKYHIKKSNEEDDELIKLASVNELINISMTLNNILLDFSYSVIKIKLQKEISETFSNEKLINKDKI